MRLLALPLPSFWAGVLYPVCAPTRLCCCRYAFFSLFCFGFFFNLIFSLSLLIHLCVTPPPFSDFANSTRQTAPAELVGQLEKNLREISTFDGVLEFHNEHFWAVSYGQLAGSLHVRIRRDANEQAVLAQVIQKLAPLVPPSQLTIQVSKDSWTRRL